MSSTIIPFEARIGDETINDLRSRLQHTRFPRKETVPGWSQGVPMDSIMNLANYWREKYDMQRLEHTLNAYPQYTSVISNVNIHFLHIKSSRPEAIAMLLVHGWPGSVLEFRHVIDPLTNPKQESEPACHLVIPSLPGYGFSGTPLETGYGFEKTGRIFADLMERLGYADSRGGYQAQGGDWGADIVADMGHRAYKGLRAVHMNTAFFDAKKEANLKEIEPAELKTNASPLTKAATKALRLQETSETNEDGYFKQQATRPQTLGYSLADSPVGQLAWIYEKLVMWSDDSRRGNDQGQLSKIPLSVDELLDNVMLYWVTNTGASSARMNWEAQMDSTAVHIDARIPVGVGLFPADLSWACRRWAEKYYQNIVQWNEVEAGGHYGAWEVPGILVQEMRDFANAIASWPK